MESESSRPQSDLEDQPARRQADEVSPQYPPVHIAAQAWAGPLPSPDDFRNYDSVLQGAAERILTMAEQEASHRRAIERSEFKRSFTGLMVGGLVAIAALGAGSALIFNGSELAGTIIVGVDLVGLAGVFVYGSRNR